ncbi:hypothetical protein H5410_032231 [Solanum commersonii]|uniref:DUF7746 domain-containing protein n=1 Tax=Solanum commersonii TaxID=4109 RepID=A0A9J5YLK1_SOLCO|nr:hypothetical protein H5410_032231 [Solanum commersonii]
MIIAGFTGQLRGWWDNYMSIEQKAAVINVIVDNEVFDNLGITLVKNGEDVYTLVLTILKHFNGRFTNQYKTVRTLLNGLRCRTLDDFPPLFAERVRKALRTNHGEIPYKNYTDGKLIGVCTQEGINLGNELKLSRQLKMDELKEISQLGDFCAQFDLPDTFADSKKKTYRNSNPDKPYRKKRSRYRSKE